MKMVSAAKLKRSQDAIVQVRPYADKLGVLMANVSATLDSSENPYAIERPLVRVLLIPVTANRGLCGAFNSSVLKRTKIAVEQFANEGVAVDIFALGKKGREQLRKLENLVGSDIEVVAKVSFDAARSLAQGAMNDYASGKYDRVVLVYNQFKNAAIQLVREEVVLPIAQPEGGPSSDYLYEPNKMELLNSLIPTHIHMQFFKALLDSQASEQGARMTAMHKATDNAKSMRDGLKLDYNKARQAAITNEILEIVGGAEALSS
jgi:F-type H+-transporting ATPase subunit gamma